MEALMVAVMLLGGFWALVWIVCRRSAEIDAVLASDPLDAHFGTVPRESGYLPAASLSPDEIATLADLERRLRASNTPYVTGSVPEGETT
jgi:hypothetical protein